MNEAQTKGYRRLHRLLHRAKMAGWKISLTGGGHWRAVAPSGGGFTVAQRPTVRSLAVAEALFGKTRRTCQ